MNNMIFNPGSFTGVLEELKMLGLAAVVGTVMGAVFDIFRLLRISLPHKTWMVFLEDFLFTLFFGVVFFCFSVEMLEGKLRLYVLAGMMLGFGIYLVTLGRIISGFFRLMANILRKISDFATGKLKNAGSAKKFSEK